MTTNNTTNQGEGNRAADKRFRTMQREFVANQRNEGDGPSLTDLVAKLDAVRTVMVTCSNEKGGLASRPLTLQSVEDDGTLWFIVGGDVAWLGDRGAVNVNVSVSEGMDGYVSIAGIAFLVEDEARLNELWSPLVSAFFTHGPRRSDARLLRVDPRRVEWWTPTNVLERIWETTRALVTDEAPDLGNKHRFDIPATLDATANV